MHVQLVRMDMHVFLASPHKFPRLAPNAPIIGTPDRIPSTIGNIDVRGCVVMHVDEDMHVVHSSPQICILPSRCTNWCN